MLTNLGYDLLKQSLNDVMELIKKLQEMIISRDKERENYKIKSQELDEKTKEVDSKKKTLSLLECKMQLLEEIL